MNEVSYTNRELDSHFRDIKDSLVRIESQTVKTNGRVSKLETYKSFTQGSIAIITALLIPIILFIVSKWIEK